MGFRRVVLNLLSMFLDIQRMDGMIISCLLLGFSMFVQPCAPCTALRRLEQACSGPIRIQRCVQNRLGQQETMFSFAESVKTSTVYRDI